MYYIKKSINKNNGFTLVELMVSLGIIAILATASMAMYSDYTVKVKMSVSMVWLDKYKMEVAQIYSETATTEIRNLTEKEADRVKAYLPLNTAFWSSQAGVLINLGSSQIITAMPEEPPMFNKAGVYMTVAPHTDDDVTTSGIKWRCTAFNFDTKYLPSWCA